MSYPEAQIDPAEKGTIQALLFKCSLAVWPLWQIHLLYFCHDAVWVILCVRMLYILHDSKLDFHKALISLCGFDSISDRVRFVMSCFKCSYL